ncbi:acyltransferase family protein [Streptomyces sp. RB6PN25]|uniref:Acyltransferase family protein n=1 Tax=Streptomyces humicola TaxID=2953240 RepID=A0ABT1Q1V3_9ACTN|nr:lysophospholipid acyltransferase family protein [Streptomyces humicola]MCQ4083906.1 acyltransferase family protein [Streptomyces humicola]
MADGKIIPLDKDTRSRRGGARPGGRASGARRKSAPAGEPGLTTVPAVETPDAQGAQRAAARSDDGPDTARGTAGGGDVGGAGEEQGEQAGSPLLRRLPVRMLTDALGSAVDRLFGGRWERRAAGGLSFLRRRITGDYEVDEFGYDEELTDQVFMSLLRPLFDNYFRIEVKGIENIPSQGGALVVCNHSGTLPWDALMTQVAVHDHHPARRHLRLLAADLVFLLPVINELARKGGHTLACPEDAQLLLENGEIVGDMPEGFKGLGKPFSERYKLQRFGRGGFVSTALRTGVPIVPCSIVGAEEIYPMVGNAKTLARLLGLPYFPVTPTFPWLGLLGMIPLPTKWTIQFGEPIPTDHYPPEAADDPMLVFNLTDQVRETIQHTLYKLLVQRRSVFF